MKISLDYKEYGVDLSKLTAEQLTNLVKPHEIVMSYLKGAVSQKFDKGLPTDKLRILNNIIKKFDKASEADSAEIPLNEYEEVFLKECYQAAKFDVNNTKPAMAVHDMLFTELVEGAAKL